MPWSQQGVPTKAMAQVFHIFPGPGKKKRCLLAGSSSNLTGRQYLFQLPLSCLWLVKAQGFSCCKALGEQANLPHHDTNMHPTGIEPWPILQKGLQEPNVYLEPKWLRCQPSFKRCAQDPSADIPPAKCWAHTMSEGRVDRIHVTRGDWHPLKPIPPLHHTKNLLSPHKKNKGRVEDIHVTRGHWHPFKLILSHLHAGLSLARSVASLSHPSVTTCQTITGYSMIALQTAS